MHLAKVYLLFMTGLLAFTWDLKWYSTYTRLVWLGLTIFFIWLFFRPTSTAVQGLDHIARVLESTGGKILLLTTLAMIFFIASLSFFFYVLDAIQAHTLQDDDVMVNMVVQFVTGSAFGTALGALINLLGVGTTASTTMSVTSPPGSTVTSHPPTVTTPGGPK